MVPFVAKVMESSAKSKVFKPPNPWVIAIMAVLTELHQVPDLKVSEACTHTNTHTHAHKHTHSDAHAHSHAHINDPETQTNTSTCHVALGGFRRPVMSLCYSFACLVYLLFDVK